MDSTNMDRFDSKIVNDFLDESNELLETIEEDFLKLESQADDINDELINNIFRAIHTIKGSSTFLGYTKISELSHLMENILSTIRNSGRVENPDIIDALLAGVDKIKDMLHDINKSNQFNIQSEMDYLNSCFQEEEESEPEEDIITKTEMHDSLEVEDQESLTENDSDFSEVKDLIQILQSESRTRLDMISDELYQHLKGNTLVEIEKLKRYYSIYNLLSGLFRQENLHNIADLLYSLEDILSDCIDSNIEFNSKAQEFFLKCNDKLLALIDDYQFSEKSDIDYLLDDIDKLFSSNEQEEVEEDKDKTEIEIEDEADNVKIEETEIVEDIPTEELHSNNEEELLSEEETVSNEGIEEDTVQDISIDNNEQEEIEEIIVDIPIEETKILEEIKEEILKEKVEISDNIESTKSLRIPENEKSESVRINVEVLNKLMRLAGELVLVRNQQLIHKDELEIEKRESIQRLDNITSEIQELIMNTRLQSLESIFNKFPRIVRDMSKKLGKNIDLEIKGSDVELDKAILESLTAPLTHILRNSVDHGIESPEERIEKNKSENGNIIIKAFHEGGLVNIIVKDDGRGLNLEKIKSKALAQGLINPSQVNTLSDEDIINLIFLPGFTTTDEVNEISGRGVGMDVVNTEIEKLSGNIKIISKESEGTKINIRLPLTLAIIPCLIIRTGNDIFAIPQVNLEELISFDSNFNEYQIEHTNNQEYLRVRNSILPIVRLDEVLSNPEVFNENFKVNLIKTLSRTLNNDNEIQNFAVLRAAQNKYVLYFDELLGTEEIVVKPMHSALKHIPIYSGATILGDGKVSLILDTDGLAKHADVKFNLNKEEDVELEQSDTIIDNKESVLLFESCKDSQQFAIPLEMIKRIETISKKDIQKLGDEKFLQIREILYRVIALEELFNLNACEKDEEIYLITLKHIKQNAGIIATNVIDSLASKFKIDNSSFRNDMSLGTDFVNNKVTIFLDVYKILEKIYPECELPEFNESANILIVEDSRIFLEMISNYFIDQGFKVYPAEDAVKAMAIYKKHPVDFFDIIISDLEMPNMDGFEFASHIRKKEKNLSIPMIALSAMEDENAERRALNSGFNTFQQKLNKGKLVKAVNNLLESNLSFHEEL